VISLAVWFWNILSKNYSDLQAVKDDITLPVEISFMEKWEFTLIARSYESLTHGLMTFSGREMHLIVGAKLHRK
jgi:hypothetical protein